MFIVRFLVRLIGFFSLCGIYLTLLLLNQLIGSLGFYSVRRTSIHCTKYFARLVLYTFNIKVKTKLQPTKEASLYLCNHLSYLDAVAVMSQLNAAFITSTEIRDTPGLGHICRMASCLFVNRKSIWGLLDEVKQISSTLTDGHSVVLFPEGTTTSGHHLNPFKSSLVQGAVLAGKPIVPITINYTKFNGRQPLLEDRDYYCWYGTMNFIPHIVRLCTIDSLEVELCQSSTIYPQQRLGERKLLTSNSRSLIEREYLPVTITS